MRYAVILAGGGGTRLWPASRRKRPKQLLALGSDPSETLLEATARRLASIADRERIFIVTTSELADSIGRSLPWLPKENILSEPAPRNTAAAIGLAAVHLNARDPEAVLGVFPADQYVGEERAFHLLVERAFDYVGEGDAIVTIGIPPTRPETGFGYLEVAGQLPSGVRPVVRFVEKPDLETATAYLHSGHHLWNGGIFFLRAQRILKELEHNLPATHGVLAEIGKALAQGGLGAALATAARLYPTVPSVSIDHGVMERTQGIVTLPGDFGWNDVGSWPSLAEIRPADEHGNVTQGLVITSDAENNIALTDEGNVVALLGVSDLVVVKSGNAVLVMPRSRAQEVRTIVAELEARTLEPYL